jgi:hypothetical protein
MRRLWTIGWLLLLAQGATAQQPGLGSIEGKVIDRESGAPVARAHVELRRAVTVSGVVTTRSMLELTAAAENAKLFLGSSGTAAPAASGPTSGGTQSVASDSKVATTSVDGTFVIRNVPAGRYHLYATRSSGHTPGEYGQRTATEAGVPFELRSGQRMAGVSLVMTPAGSITGYVTDTGGEPAGFAHVQALKAVYRDGRRTLTVMQLVQADERGAFRLFWLPPGEYYVCAKQLDLRRSSEMMHITPPSRFGTYEQQMRPTVTAVNTSRLLEDGSLDEGQYVPICYPGTANDRDASPVSVQVGQTVSGVDINLADSLVRTRRIRGRVIDGSTGKPAPASLQLVPRNAPAILLIPTGQAGVDGTFDMWGALPGPNYLVANIGALNGLLEIDISGSDMNGVTVTVWPPVTIQGRIRIQGRSPSEDDRDVAGISVRLRRNPAVNGLSNPAAARSENVVVRTQDGQVFTVAEPRNNSDGASSANGSFRVSGVGPGTYTVVVGVKSDMYLESIRLGDRDVLNEGLLVDGPEEGRLEIVLGMNGGSILGSVYSARREPVARATVVAVPDAQRRGRADLYKVATTESSGGFELQGLAPGSYELFAWDTVEPGAWQDPDFIRAHAGLGRPVRIDGGGPINADVNVVTGRR